MPVEARSMRSGAPSFAAPVLHGGVLHTGKFSKCSRTAPRASRRRTRRPGYSRLWLACTNGPAPEEDKPEGGDVRDDANKSGTLGKKDSNLERIEALTGTTIAEIDELAEEWIGADLGRWEWYERVKARRARMLKVGRENEEKFDKELQELKRTFMEIDALFGTRMLDDNSEISATGWSTVAVITLLYVCAGFWVIELVVRLLTGGFTPSFP